MHTSIQAAWSEILCSSRWVWLPLVVMVVQRVYVVVGDIVEKCDALLTLI